MYVNKHSVLPRGESSRWARTARGSRPLTVETDASMTNPYVLIQNLLNRLDLGSAGISAQ
ncbi:Uncharacterised protein [Nocardia africana]|uniref:Uncharacterized protein n=1 Tax=Nocardia africana TaxID=134964 RepID=A0A378WPJ4_9NOCA|nr:Uncharacterised protein [Nocardia africana]